MDEQADMSTTSVITITVIDAENERRPKHGFRLHGSESSARSKRSAILLQCAPSGFIRTPGFTLMARWCAPLPGFIPTPGFTLMARWSAPLQRPSRSSRP
ncbi:MAG: hypothetical protein WBQ23_01805, partial [Bacteroidota bacterium]